MHSLARSCVRRLAASASSAAATPPPNNNNNFYRHLNQSILKCATAQEVERLIWQNKRYNGVNLATALSQLKRTGSRNPQSLNRILNFCSAAKTDEFDPQALAVSVHAIASGRLLPKIPQVFIRMILEKQPKQLAEFSPRALSNILWSFAELDQNVPEITNALRREIFHSQDAKRTLDEFNLKDMSTLLWALATLRVELTPLESAMVTTLFLHGEGEDAYSKQLDKLPARDLANLIFAWHWHFNNINATAFQRKLHARALELKLHENESDRAKIARAFAAWEV